jgi:hypothetical protein
MSGMSAGRLSMRSGYGPVPSRGLIASGLMAYAFLALLLSVVWPRYGFYSVGPIDATPYTIMAILAWAVVPAALLLMPAAGRQLWRAVSVRPVMFSVLISWILWRALSSAIGPNPGFSLTYLAREVVYLLPLLPLVILMTQQPDGRRLALSCILLATAIVTVVALVEMITGQSIIRLLSLRFSGDSQRLALIAESNFGRGSSGIRIQSVFNHPIVFAQFLAWAAPFLLFTAMGRTRMWMRLTALGCLAALPVLILATDARSGLIALAAALTTYGAIVLVRRVGLFSLQSAAATFLAIALVLGAFSAGQGTVGGLIQGRNAVEVSSTQARSAMFERGLSEISASPIVGFGDGMSPQYAGLRGRNGLLTIDSAFLSSLLDSGWMGLSMQLAVWGLALVFAARAALHPRATGFDVAVAASLVGVMSVFAVLSIMDNLSLIYISIGLTSAALLRVPSNYVGRPA